MKKVYLAVDLGAESGRVIAGLFDGTRLELEELHRFNNGPVSGGSSLHWDIEPIFDEIKKGIAEGVSRYGSDVVSVAVDTWGVDYGLIDPEGKLIGKPFHYRDSRTDGMQEKVFEKVDKGTIFAETGIQFMFFNTLFQLYSEVDGQSERLNKAETLLFMPDLINYWLCGVKANERTIASTSQMLNAHTGAWSATVLEALNIPQALMADIVEPGNVLGELRDAVAEASGGVKLKVVNVGSHDTASAIAAVPSEVADYAYLSSGTWSLMGIELPEPLTGARAMELGFSNEGGVEKTIRLLKNISGLWLWQECRRVWAEAGDSYDYAEMTAMAEGAEPFTFLIDPDYPEFASPGDMPQRIAAYLEKTGQPVFKDRAHLLRGILESLALKYRKTFEDLEALTGKQLECLHIVGGGTQNKMLNQFAANAIGRKTITGPIEATSAGNVLMQMLAAGDIESLAAGRKMVGQSFLSETYLPQESDAWGVAYEKFKSLL